MTAGINQPEETSVPAEQRDELLTCHYRELDNAVIHLQYAETKPEQLARLQYVKETTDRLEKAIHRLVDEPEAGSPDND